MKIIAAAAATLSLLLAVPGQAQDLERIKSELRKKVPEAPVDSVRKVPYGGLFEVTIGSEVFYTDENASFLVLGSIVDLKTKENVTELRMRQLNKVDFAQLPFDSAIKIVRGNGSRKVAIFEDPNCGYCKKFERDLLAVSDISVYVFLYPILAADSMDKSKAVWCSADQGKAWLDLMLKNAQPAVADAKCDTTAVDKSLAFGRSKRVGGTPTIIFEDGDRVPGAISMADFEKRLKEAKAGGSKQKVSQR